jgi:hypothetical protein
MPHQPELLRQGKCNTQAVSLEARLFQAARETAYAPVWPAAARETTTLTPWVAINEKWNETAVVPRFIANGIAVL